MFRRHRDADRHGPVQRLFLELSLELGVGLAGGSDGFAENDLRLADRHRDAVFAS